METRKFRYNPTRKYYSNFSAGVQIIEQAANVIYNFDSAIIFTDAPAELQVISVIYPKDNRIPQQWVPSHSGVPANERTYRLVKIVGKCQQPARQ